MAISGPVTKDTSSLTLGLAQIRVGSSSSHIAAVEPQLTAANSVGSLTSSKLTLETEWWRHEAGFPLLEDYVIALREKAMLEGELEEITPLNLAISRGKDPTGAREAGFTAHSGEVLLGDKAVSGAAPDYVRVEARYTFPNGSNYMDVIFPRAQVTSTAELDLQKEDNAKIPVTFEAKRADSEVSGGNAVWDDRPLGWVKFS